MQLTQIGRSKRDRTVRNPRVVFLYSSVYDEQWKNAWRNLPKKEGRYPSPNFTQRYLSRLEEEWRKDEQRVFASILKYSGIPWFSLEHTCYVVGYMVPFSDPLTIPVFRTEVPIDYVIDVLTHELIHRNLIQRQCYEKVEQALARLRQAYPRESENVIIHIIVHAIHERVFEEVFSTDRLRREKKIMFAITDYKRAWEIVESLGAEKVIQTFLTKYSFKKNRGRRVATPP
ncbi:hypothetical protein EPN90_01335 [Patescibacteria group bacterium]|nr:MAG: hypothetical protein EPN90_01335 [Patescibacteria group bacterium]